MPKLTARQESILLAIDNLKKAGRGVVIQYETTLSEYWGESRCRTDDIAFLINALKRMPRLQSAAIKLLPMHIPVTIKCNDGIHIVTNKKNAPKQMKAKGRLNVLALVEMELDSLLHHPKFGGKGDSADKLEYDWTKKQGSFKKTVLTALENDVSSKDLIDIIIELAARQSESLDSTQEAGVVIEMCKDIEHIAEHDADMDMIGLLEDMSAMSACGTSEEVLSNTLDVAIAAS